MNNFVLKKKIEEIADFVMKNKKNLMLKIRKIQCPYQSNNKRPWHWNSVSREEHTDRQRDDENILI